MIGRAAKAVKRYAQQNRVAAGSGPMAGQTTHGAVDAYASGLTNLIPDMFGYFAPWHRIAGAPGLAGFHTPGVILGGTV